MSEQANKKPILGPGQYDHAREILPLYKLKPSAAFVSRSQREAFSGTIKKEMMKQKLLRDAKTHLEVHNNIIDSDEYEYVEDSTPGPGHYESKTLTSISHQTKS